MPHHEGNTRRRRAIREPRQRLLVVVGTKKTEEQYLAGLRDSLSNRSVDIRIVNRARSPREVVDYAIGYLSRAKDDFDEAWCVFDVDDFDIATAVREADKAGLLLAVSDPCFELWLLLHHEHCAAYQDGYRAVERRLRKHISNYDKSRLDFKDYEPGITSAMHRAEKLGSSGNPSTGMWRLAGRIRNEEQL